MAVDTFSSGGFMTGCHTCAICEQLEAIRKVWPDVAAGLVKAIQEIAQAVAKITTA
jgi:hypothetical protein